VLDTTGGAGQCKPWQSFSHVAPLAIIEAHAFVPTVFWENTLLDLRDPAWKATGDLRNITPEQLREGVAAELDRKKYWNGWPRRFDIVLYLHLGAPVIPLPEGMESLYQGRAFALYQSPRRR
jgi:hypothetical protein